MEYHQTVLDALDKTLIPGASNAELVPHTVTAPEASIESGSIAPGASWKLIARRKGQIDYICRFHPVMHGTLAVR